MKQKISGANLYLPVLQLDGEPFPMDKLVNVVLPNGEVDRDQDGFPKKKVRTVDMTVREAIRNALGQPTEDKDQKLTFFALSRKIFKVPEDGEVELPATQRAIVIQKCKDIYTPEAYGFIYEILEGQAPEPKED